MTRGGEICPSRRRLIRLGLTALPMISIALTLPTKLFAAQTPTRKPRAPRVLMLDPGHGGHDPGTIGTVSGIYEKDVTLDVAKRMAAELANSADITVRLTRDTDEFLPLPERVEISRSAGADLFISIHADSAPSSAARGLSVYTLSEKASDAFSRQLAERENHSDIADGGDFQQTDKDVAEILFDLTARRTRNTAQRAKVGFVNGMGRKWHLLENPMRAANFAVLRSPDVPSMLVETGFLSNPHDEDILGQPSQRQKIAQLMAKEVGSLLRSSLFG